MARKVVTVTPSQKRTRRERTDFSRQVRDLASVDEVTKTTTTGLPAGAAPGPLGPSGLQGGYWNLFPAVVPAHQTTSLGLAGIYPFVADTGIGEKGPILGVDLNADSLWHYSPWDLYFEEGPRGTQTTNLLVLGGYGAGKSGTIKQLCVRSLAFGRQVVVPSDSKGEWVRVAEAVGGTVIRLGGGNTQSRLNPLDAGPRRSGSTEDEHAQIVQDRRVNTLLSLIEATLKGQPPLNPMETSAIMWALRTAITETNDNPTIAAVYRQLNIARQGSSKHSEELTTNGERAMYVLQRFVIGDLRGLFEEASTVRFDDEAPMVVVDTSELFARGELVAQLTQICTSAWIQAVISDLAAKRTRYLVREEGWRDMASKSALETYRTWLKLSRHYGVANIVILHKFSDFDAVGEEGSAERALAYSMAGDIENKFIFRTTAQEVPELERRLHLPATHAQAATGLRAGVFLAYVGLYSYMVDAFATSTPWEVDLFTTDSAIAATRNPIVEAGEPL